MRCVTILTSCVDSCFQVQLNLELVSAKTIILRINNNEQYQKQTNAEFGNETEKGCPLSKIYERREIQVSSKGYWSRRN